MQSVSGQNASICGCNASHSCSPKHRKQALARSSPAAMRSASARPSSGTPQHLAGQLFPAPPGNIVVYAAVPKRCIIKISVWRHTGCTFFSQKSVHPKCTAAAGSHCYKQSSPGLRRLTKGHFPQRKGRCIIDELNFLLQQAADFGECSAQIAAVQCIVFVQPL